MTNPAVATPSISIIDGKPVTTSKNIAEFFSKRHDNVLKLIRSRISEAGNWGLLNFKETPYIDEQNGQKYSMFTLTKDGFVFLVQKFTGKKAVQHQIAYIEQFNQMAAQLYNQPPQLDQQPITPAQLHNLKQAARREAKRQNQPVAECYEYMLEVFGVNELRELTRDDYPFACAMLGTSEVEGEWLRSEMPPLPTAPRYHYPRHTLKPVNKDAQKQSWLTVQMLIEQDNNRPLRDLLQQLKREGHNVEGPELEYQAMIERMRDLYWTASDAVRGLNTALESGRSVVWE